MATLKFVILVRNEVKCVSYVSTAPHASMERTQQGISAYVSAHTRGNLGAGSWFAFA
jgi:hypothetical protein